MFSIEVESILNSRLLSSGRLSTSLIVAFSHTEDLFYPRLGKSSLFLLILLHALGLLRRFHLHKLQALFQYLHRVLGRLGELSGLGSLIRGILGYLSGRNLWLMDQISFNIIWMDRDRLALGSVVSVVSFGVFWAASVEEIFRWWTKLVSILFGWIEIDLPYHRHRCDRWSACMLSSAWHTSSEMTLHWHSQIPWPRAQDRPAIRVLVYLPCVRAKVSRKLSMDRTVLVSLLVCFLMESRYSSSGGLSL